MRDTPKDERIVYDVTVESMFFRALKGRISERCKQRLKAAGLDLDAKLKPSYSRDVWQQCLRIAVEEVYPSVPEAQAFRELGERVADSLRETTMGPAIMGMLRLLGPKRGLKRMTQNFEYANNYNQTKLEELGPNSFRLWINEAGISPHFIAGTVSAVLKAAGAPNAKIEIERFDGQECTYLISF